MDANAARKLTDESTKQAHKTHDHCGDNGVTCTVEVSW